MDTTRVALGVVAGLLAAIGGWLWLSGDTVNGGIVLRVGLVCAGVWLAWPVLTTRSLTRIGIVALSMLVVLFRPRAALVVIPVILVWAAARPRQTVGRR